MTQMNTLSDAQAGRWVLIATIAASAMTFIDGSALNVALSAIQTDLGASGADLLWIINSYLLFLAALLLLGGSLGDHYGRKRVLMIGIGVFLVASLACGLAPTSGFLIAMRALQGIGAALMVPGSLALLSGAFGDESRGAAIGTWTAFTTLTSVLGPFLGGFLTEIGFWRGVFFLNIPIGLVSLWILWRYVAEQRDETASDKFDNLGSLLVVLGLAGFTYGFIELGRRGIGVAIGDPVVLIALIGGIVSFVLFIVVEARSDHPMMPLDLFRSRTFSGANLLTLLLYGALGGALFFLPLNLIQIQGYSETLAGLSFLPFSILLIVMARWSGGLVPRYGPRLPLVVGPLIVTVGFILFSLPGVTAGPSDYWTSFFIPGVVFGIGMGVTVAPLVTTVMGSVSQSKAGIASGINNAMSRSSQVLAIAVMGGIALLTFTGSLQAYTADVDLSADVRAELEAEAVNLGATRVPEAVDTEAAVAVEDAIKTSFVDTYRLMMLIGAGMALVSAILAAIFIEREMPKVDGGSEPSETDELVAEASG